MKTQEERLRYILNGGKLKRMSDGTIVGIKDGMIWDFADNLESMCVLKLNEWIPYIEPLKVEFECEWLEKNMLIYPDAASLLLREMVGKGRFKVTCEQIIEESK